jgi:hypothetical protein
MTSSVRLSATLARLRALSVLTYPHNRPAFSYGFPSEGPLILSGSTLELTGRDQGSEYATGLLVGKTS